MRINEIFYSLQGEGRFTGSPAVFVRFSGCNRRCPFCDTDHLDGDEMSAQEIVDAVSKYPCDIVVITGGEPALQLTSELVEMLHGIGRRVHVETNGSLPLPVNVDWITCSPKDPPYGIDRIDELKIVYQAQDVESLRQSLPKAAVCSLQPLSGSNITETIEYIKSHPWWTLSLQTHKLIDIP